MLKFFGSAPLKPTTSTEIAAATPTNLYGGCEKAVCWAKAKASHAAFNVEIQKHRLIQFDAADTARLAAYEKSKKEIVDECQRKLDNLTRTYDAKTAERVTRRTQIVDSKSVADTQVGLSDHELNETRNLNVFMKDRWEKANAAPKEKAHRGKPKTDPRPKAKLPHAAAAPGRVLRKRS